MNYNRIIIGGRLGKDAELATTQAGKSVLRFSLAVSGGYGDKKKTEWFSCSMWGERAQKLEPFLKKGVAVLIDGSLSTSASEYNGKNYTNLNVFVDNLAFAGSKQEQQEQQEQAQAQTTQTSFFNDDDGVPF